MQTPSSKHEALSVMLSCLGVSPQIMEEDAPSSEEVLAEKVLDDVLADIQTQGWAFNREQNFPLTPQEDGRILLPPSLLKVEKGAIVKCCV